MSTLFTIAFRPLFLFATLYAIVIVPYWLAAWLGAHPMPVSLGSPIWWHAHEMIYGFAAAAVGGFALTAVATWTKRPPVSGAPLMLLTGAWLFARMGFASRVETLLPAAMGADLAYGVLLFLLMSREVVSARNDRNYKTLLILALLPVTNAAFFAGLAYDAPWQMAALLAGLWLIVLMINLIGGRIIPAFTQNWLKRNVRASAAAPSEPVPTFNRFDLFTTWLLMLFASAQVAGAPANGSALLGIITGALLLIRLGRWQGWRARSEPLVWVLHLAFAWIPLGILLLSAAELGLVPRTAGTHALTTGAVTTMILAVAGRAALGHTKRPLESHPVLTASYLLITLAAITRVAATFGPGARVLMMISATAWTLGFLCFAWRYAPILTQPAADKPGRLPTI